MHPVIMETIKKCLTLNNAEQLSLSKRICARKFPQLYNIFHPVEITHTCAQKAKKIMMGITYETGQRCKLRFL